MAGKKKDSAATAAPATGTEAKKPKYNTWIFGVPKSREDLQKSVVALAEKLGCRASHLMYMGLERIIADPPESVSVPTTERGAGGGGFVGSAPGFWTVPVIDPKTSRATNVKVVEVKARPDVKNGRTFFRFKDGDAKERGRARNQAIKAAKYDLQLIGVTGVEPKVTDLPQAAPATA